MAVKTYPKKSGVRLSDHFTSSEFDCPCSNCDETQIADELLQKLGRMREKLGEPLRINSGYRCRAYQSELKARGYETAAGVSQHELGNAADIMASDSETPGTVLEVLAQNAGFKAIGVGHAWIHVDLRDDKNRRWTYTR